MKRSRLKLYVDFASAKNGGGANYFNEFCEYTSEHEESIGKFWREVVIFLPETDKKKRKDTGLIKFRKAYRNPLLLFMWRLLILPITARLTNGFIFNPGTSFIISRRQVTMFRNLLPLDKLTFQLKFSKKSLIRYRMLSYMHFVVFTISKQVICLNRYCSKLLFFKGIKHTSIVTHGVSEIRSVKPAYLKNKKDIKLLYVSRFASYKNHSTVIAGLEELKKRGLPVKLVLVGEDDANASLHQLINRSVNSKDIEYLEKLSSSELSKIYKDIDICVFASKIETFSMIIVEGMNQGKPLVCSNRSAMRAVAGNAALYFNSDSEFSLADQIEKLIKDEDLRHEFSEKAFAKSLEFNWNDTFQKTYKILESAR